MRAGASSCSRRPHGVRSVFFADQVVAVAGTHVLGLVQAVVVEVAVDLDLHVDVVGPDRVVVVAVGPVGIVAAVARLVLVEVALVPVHVATHLQIDRSGVGDQLDVHGLTTVDVVRLEDERAVVVRAAGVEVAECELYVVDVAHDRIGVVVVLVQVVDLLERDGAPHGLGIGVRVRIAVCIGICVRVGIRVGIRVGVAVGVCIGVRVGLLAAFVGLSVAVVVGTVAVLRRTWIGSRPAVVAVAFLDGPTVAVGVGTGVATVGRWSLGVVAGHCTHAAGALGRRLGRNTTACGGDEQGQGECGEPHGTSSWGEEVDFRKGRRFWRTW